MHARVRVCGRRVGGGWAAVGRRTPVVGLYEAAARDDKGVRQREQRAPMRALCHLRRRGAAELRPEAVERVRPLAELRVLQLRERWRSVGVVDGRPRDENYTIRTPFDKEELSEEECPKTATETTSPA